MAKLNVGISKVFGVIDYESEVRISKFKMEISHTIFQWILNSFAVIDFNTSTQGFQRLAMTILKSNFRNSKWRIQYGGHIIEIQSILNFLATIGLQTITREFSRSLKTVVNSDFEMTDPMWRLYIRFPVKIRRFWSE